MALDEPNDDDEKFETGGLTFLIAPSVSKMVKSFGEINIDFVDYPWGGQITVKAAGSTECC